MDSPSEERMLQMTNAVMYHSLREEARQEEDSDMLEAMDEIRYPQDEDGTAREISEKLLYISEMVNEKLDENLVKQLQEHFDKNGFEKVADDFRSLGGTKTWGGVATIICLSCRVAKKLAKTRGISAFLQFIGWTIDYVKEKLVPWIISAGGWVAVLGRRSTSTDWNTVMIFLFGALTGSAIVYKVMK